MRICFWISQELIGKTAIELLLNRINSKDMPKQTRYFQTKLIIRESTLSTAKNL
ncbi:MAG: substrate-binding domain-containing protein [Candidatus Humimicrobiaceae bacterium]